MTLFVNTTSEVLMTEDSAEDVKNTYQDLEAVFQALRIPWENFKTNLEDEDDLEN